MLPAETRRAEQAALAALAMPDFEARLAESGWTDGLRPAALRVFQINLGKLCNMRCRHCHVDAGPDRLDAVMSDEVLERCVEALERSGATTVDITGGAPELHPRFAWLVERAVERGLQVIDRCNLTVLLLPRFEHLPGWLAERGVEIVASLPHSRAHNTDAQRGEGTFARSIEALRRLNAAGYGRDDPRRVLTLMHNPAGAFLPGGQASMQREWRAELSRRHAVSFDRLIALNNMPIARFLDWLVERGALDAYMATLTAAFNPAAVPGLMCRDTLSVSWDGRLYDCDFNQMLDLPVAAAGRDIGDVDFGALASRRVVTDRHCFGCTAGAGSSCGGATT